MLWKNWYQPNLKITMVSSQLSAKILPGSSASITNTVIFETSPSKSSDEQPQAV
jgi:hypothetical protein